MIPLLLKEISLISISVIRIIMRLKRCRFLMH
ncbi:unnamed protein product [Spirodela intermedia]|uniref:Uncharacterized protein n=1 Tax=Spirodela intermedia TaxID=51605 RepID=A0A7I8LBZ5_SPIIN|nr:unnamed protein product [Spirodela intermedia]